MITRIGTLMVAIYRIEVEILPNDEDWQFVWISDGKVKQMAVF